jgi:hypothetical protein
MDSIISDSSSCFQFGGAAVSRGAPRWRKATTLMLVLLPLLTPVILLQMLQPLPV